jgi:hypothetical protein
MVAEFRLSLDQIGEGLSSSERKNGRQRRFPTEQLRRVDSQVDSRESGKP